MALLIWTGAANNGNWDDPLNWSIGGQPAGRIPGNADDVDMGGGPHLPFPTLSSNATVNSLVVNETTFVASGATLDVAGSISVVATSVDMSFDVAGTVQAGAIANLDSNGLLTGGQRANFVIEAGGTFIDLDTPGAASPIDTLLTNVSLSAGSKFEVSNGVNLIDITASLFNVSGTATLSNELSLNAHNTPFLNSINVVSNGRISLVNDNFQAAELFIDASSIVGGVGSIAVTGQSITNNGQLWSESQGTSSLLIANDVVGTGSARLFDGSTLEFAGAVASSETINFDAPETGEKLIIDAVNAAGFAATLQGFTTLDTIDLTHTTAKSATIDGSDLLVLRDASGATVATLQMTGDYTGKTFLVSGDGAAGSLLSVFTNQAPVTTAPASEIASKGTPFAFTGANQISVTDSDALSGTGENITVVLTDTTGLLSAFVNGAGGGASITGSGTQQLTISGGLGQVNAALGTLSFLSNSLGVDQIDVATSDGRGGSDDHTIAINVVANQPPVTTVPVSEIASTGTPLAFTGANQISVADPDALSGTGENITVVLTDTSGLLSAFVAGSGGGAGITGSGTQQLTISGGLGQVNAALATLTFLGSSAGPDQIDVATSDGRGGSDDHKIAVNVVANQPPVTTVPASEIASTNTPLVFTGFDQISVADPDAQSGAGENMTVVLTDTTGLLSAFPPGSGGGASITGSGTQQLTISGGLGQVNAALATLSFLSNSVGPDQIDIATNDGRGGSDDHKIAINVVANQPPVTTAPASETVSKGTALSFTGADQISVADPDAQSGTGENMTVVLTDTTGLLSAFVPGSGGGASITGSGTQQLIISGGLGQVNAALATLSFLSNSVGPDQIDVATSDGRGGSDDHKIAVTVTPGTNVPFSIIAPSSAITGVNQAGSISGISLVESPTTPGETFSIVLSDVNGALSASTLVPGGGGTIVNSGANTLTITGTLDQVNADLTTLTDTNTSTTPDSLFMLASNSNGESAPFVSVDVSVNGAPTITTPSVVRAPAGLVTPVPLMKVAETGNTTGEVFVVVLSDAYGLLSANFGGSPVIGSGTNHLTLSGSLDQVNAELASLTITGTVVGLEFITGGVGDGFGNASGQFRIPVVTEKTWTSTVASDPNNWNNAANWTTPGAPIAGQDIFIPGTGPQPIIFDGATGLISGSVTNNGTITLGSSASPTTLLVSGDATLFGTGKVVLSDSGLNSIQDSGTGTLENTQTIEGAGTFDLLGPVTIDTSLTLQNDTSGIINATGVNGLAMTGAPGVGARGAIINAGLIEASGKGGLVLEAVNVTNIGTIEAINGSHVDIGTGASDIGGGVVFSAVGITNTSGVIEADNGSEVALYDGTIIAGGTLRTIGTGVIRSKSIDPEAAAQLSGVTNLGTVDIDAGYQLRINGTISNLGSINVLGDAALAATLLVDSSAVLFGTGKVVLSDSGLNSIQDTGIGTLENAQTIEGAGTFYLIGPATIDTSLTLQNDTSGIINATGVNGLAMTGAPGVGVSGTIINAGLIEASGAGGLVLETVNVTNSGTIEANNGSHIDIGTGAFDIGGGIVFSAVGITNTSGIIEADNGSNVALYDGTTIAGGTLRTIGTGAIRSKSIDPEAAAQLSGVTNLGTVDIDAGYQLRISGTINNFGSINVLGDTTSAATLVVNGSAALFGTGKVVLSDSGLNSIQDTGTGTLENAQTIEGAGTFYLIGPATIDTSLTLQNDTSGIINATGLNALVIEGAPGVDIHGTLTNAGLIEASGRGGLVLDAVNVTNNGTIEANNGSHVDLENGTVISGGTLRTTGTGVIRSASAANVAFDQSGPTLDGISNGAISNLGLIEIGNGNTLRIEGTIANDGTIELLGTSTSSASLLISSNATLIGHGTVQLSDSNLNTIAPDPIFNSGGNTTLDNFETISGAGSFITGGGSNFNAVFTLHNEASGVIDATGTNALRFDTSLFDAVRVDVINDGLMEAAGTGGLIFTQTFVTNNGTIQANNGSHVDLENRTVIFGGTLRTIGTGVIQSEATADTNSGEPGPTLDGLSNGALTNLGTVDVGGNHTLRIDGTIANEGTINLLGTSTSSASLLISSNATLIGDGTVRLSDSSLNSVTPDSIFNSSGNTTLDNFETISGAGSFITGGGSNFNAVFTLHNEASGIINATGTNALKFNTTLFDAVRIDAVNDGLMEASGTGGLVFSQTFVTNNGTIQANAGSHIDFANAGLFGTSGRLLIDANATLTLSNTSIAGQAIQFLKGTNETLVLDDATIDNTTIGAHISGFSVGDRIDLTQLKVTSASLDATATLHLFSNGVEIGSLQLDSTNLGERFTAASDGKAGTSITVAPITPPQVTESLAHDTGASATDRLTDDPTLAGTGDPFAIVTFTEGSASIGTTTADASGSWSFTPANLSQGSHTVTASETNTAGAGHASLAFIYDSLAPHMAITTPDAQIANPQLTVSGTGEAGTQIQLSDNTNNIGSAVTVDATGHWSEQITLVGTGTHFVTAIDTDLAGNVGSSGVATFTLDNQIVAPANQAVVAGTAGADHITISSANFVVNGAAGNDTITLMPGSNFQFHFLNGGPGNDTLDLSQISGHVTVNLARDTMVGSQVGFSVLNSIENIIAGSGNERLIGSSGANIFQAGSGTDVITGRGGGDTFVFKAGFGRAAITDFHVATTSGNPHDILELDHSLFSQFATVQALLTSTEVTQSGSNVVVATDPAHTIELQHTSVRMLLAHANDVLFV